MILASSRCNSVALLAWKGYGNLEQRAILVGSAVFNRTLIGTLKIVNIPDDYTRAINMSHTLTPLLRFSTQKSHRADENRNWCNSFNWINQVALLLSQERKNSSDHLTWNARQKKKLRTTANWRWVGWRNQWDLARQGGEKKGWNYSLRLPYN